MEGGFHSSHPNSNRRRWKQSFTIKRTVRGIPLPLDLLISNSTYFSFRSVPTFGRDTIRRFSNNASAMKKLAARDFEDLLQVSTIPFVRISPIKYLLSLSVFNSSLRRLTALTT